MAELGKSSGDLVVYYHHCQFTQLCRLDVDLFLLPLLAFT